jgi:hypothetical protein
LGFYSQGLDLSGLVVNQVKNPDFGFFLALGLYLQGFVRFFLRKKETKKNRLTLEK